VSVTLSKQFYLVETIIAEMKNMYTNICTCFDIYAYLQKELKRMILCFDGTHVEHVQEGLQHICLWPASVYERICKI
jgi:hypothetical protein